MPENYRIFKITEDPDETLRWILLEAARKDGIQNSLPVGYKSDIDPDLSRFISLLPGFESGARMEPFSLFRLYAFITDDETLALLLGEDVAEMAHKAQTAFPLTLSLGDRILADGKAYLQRDWELIGLALPGWVILFSDEVKTACQDIVEEEVRAAFLPANDELLSQLGPEIEDRILHPLILGFFLDSLPEKDSVDIS